MIVKIFLILFRPGLNISLSETSLKRLSMLRILSLSIWGCWTTGMVSGWTRVWTPRCGWVRDATCQESVLWQVRQIHWHQVTSSHTIINIWWCRQWEVWECDPGQSAIRIHESQVQGPGDHRSYNRSHGGVQDTHRRISGHHLQLNLPEDHCWRGGQRLHRHEDDCDVFTNRKIWYSQRELPQGTAAIEFNKGELS